MTSQYITALTALAAVIISPLVTWLVARRQSETNIEIAKRSIDANLISANRQRWIDDLRNLVAEFQTTIIVLRPLSRLVMAEHTNTTEYVRQRHQGFEKATLLRSRLALLLNPSEAEHKELLIAFDTALSIANTSPEADTRRVEAELSDDIEKKAQWILKQEWERVKAGR